MSLPVDEFVMDGEAVAHQEEGQPDFHGLRSLKGQQGAAFFGFDAVRLARLDLRGETLLTRKERLLELLGKPPAGLHLANHLECRWSRSLSPSVQDGLGGHHFSKRTGSILKGLTTEWLEAKNPAYGRGTLRSV